LLVNVICDTNYVVNTTVPQPWLLFIVSITGAHGAARIRFWRSLKSTGGAALRDGVHLFPARPELEEYLAELRREIAQLGGTALLFRVPEVEEHDECELRALFDRSEEYAGWHRAIVTFCEGLAQRAETDSRRTLRQLKRELQSIDAIDYFPSAVSERARFALLDAEARFVAAFSPEEPVPQVRALPDVKREAFVNRLWATRARPWVDRVSSAWLIRRFIDPAARFVWIAKTMDCPKDAVGFDFDGAPFTHIGNLVTFEVLVASFNLGGDAALRRIAAMVHGLDTGDPSIPEAAGFETLLGGARDLYSDDDALLLHVSQTLDFMYAAFSKNAKLAEEQAR